jgi:hypothetical protein
VLLRYTSGASPGKILRRSRRRSRKVFLGSIPETARRMI